MHSAPAGWGAAGAARKALAMTRRAGAEGPHEVTKLAGGSLGRAAAAALSAALAGSPGACGGAASPPCSPPSCSGNDAAASSSGVGVLAGWPGEARPAQSSCPDIGEGLLVDTAGGLAVSSSMGSTQPVTAHLSCCKPPVMLGQQEGRRPKPCNFRACSRITPHHQERAALRW